MKIVQLCPYDMARPGGVQRNVRDLAAWCTAQGHETRIIAPPAPGRKPRREGNLTEVGVSREIAMHGTGFEISWAFGRARRALARELRDWGADVVHVHTPWTPLLAWQMGRALDLPTVATMHATLPDPDAKGLIDRYIRWAARRILPRLQGVIVPSRAPLPLLQRLMPGLEAQVLPPSVDLSAFREAAVGRAPNAGRHMVFLGRLEPRKGVDILLRAWPAIADAVPDMQLTIAGDGPMRAEVEAAVSDRVRYAGRPDDAGVQAVMASADFFAAPAPYGESFGLVLTEAMAAGAVPVAAANAGYSSVLGEDGAELLVPPGDADALAETVIGLANDPARVKRLANWAAEHAMRFDVAQTGPDYLAAFERAMAKSRTR